MVLDASIIMEALFVNVHLDMFSLKTVTVPTCEKITVMILIIEVLFNSVSKTKMMCFKEIKKIFNWN